MLLCCRSYFFTWWSVSEQFKHFANPSLWIKICDSVQKGLKEIIRTAGLHFELIFIFDILITEIWYLMRSQIYFDHNLAVPYTGNMYSTSTGRKKQQNAMNFEVFHPACFLASPSYPTTLTTPSYFQTDISEFTCSHFMRWASINTSVHYFRSSDTLFELTIYKLGKYYAQAQIP
jgi:hypothetical protein